MPDKERQRIINAENTQEFSNMYEYNSENENSVVQHIFELKDMLSYEILKQELIDVLETDNFPLFIDERSRNIVRIISENINNLEIEDPDDKFYLNTFREEIRTIVLTHMNNSYDITYNINEMEQYIDLEPIADIYEFFILRKLNNIFKYYYSIINLSFFDKTSEGDDRDDLRETLREYLLELVPNLNQDEVTDQELTMELLSEFFSNKERIVNSGISNVEGFSSFLNYIVTEDDGEFVSDRIREMFYNFGGFEGIEFDDTITFKRYFEVLSDIENANDLLVLLSTRVFKEENMR